MDAHHIKLTDEQKQRLAAVASASGQSWQEVFDKAIGSLCPDDIAAIKEGVDDMQAGRLRPFSEVDAEIRGSHGWVPSTE